MKHKKKSPVSVKTGLPKESNVLLDCANIIVTSTDPVKLVAKQIYNQLARKLYRENMRVK